MPDEFLKLCPSTKVEPTFVEPSTGRVFGQPAITYVIKIRRILIEGCTSQTQVPCSEEREIDIKPFDGPAPPIDPSHFPYDYRTHITRRLRDCRWKHPFGALSASVAEPTPLDTWTSAPSASTMVTIQLSLTPTGRHPQKFEMFGQWSWQPVVTYHIRSRTVFSTCLLRRVPSLRDADLNPFIEVKDRKTRAERQKCGALVWSRDCRSSHQTNPDTLQCGGRSRASSRSQECEEHHSCDWTATLTAPITAAKSLLPTFLNRLSARQYALVLRLDIEGLPHPVLKLVIPLQVIHCPQAIPAYSILNHATEERTDGEEQYLEYRSRETHPTNFNTGPAAPLPTVNPPSYEAYL